MKVKKKDIKEQTVEKPKKSNPVAAFFWTNKRRRAKNIYFLLTAVLLVVALGLGYVNSLLNAITYEKDNKGETVSVPKDDIVDDEEIIKVHVHTENPGKALEEGLKYGQFLTVKVENMKEQHRLAGEKKKENDLNKNQEVFEKNLKKKSDMLLWQQARD